MHLGVDRHSLPWRFAILKFPAHRSDRFEDGTTPLWTVFMLAGFRYWVGMP